ncbi:DUF6049 family protein [Leifsonia sp. YAF41]|uniref:DUF6049 family protein n=1 Tax=Leifsonia sp. YAF41 TaxID=3233086 RepID=UPI003F9C01C1
MVAESIPERRPVLPTSSVTRFARTRTVFAAVLVGIVTAASAVLIPSAAQAAAPSSAAQTAALGSPSTSVKAVTPEDGVSVQLSPTASVVLRPGEDLRVTATVTNHTPDTLPPSTIDVYLAENALTSRTAIDEWLNPESTGETPGDLLLSQPLPTEIQPGHSTTVDIVVPAANIGLTTNNVWGARGIAATLTTDAVELVDARSTFVWVSGEPITPITLATVFPLTVPAGSADTSGLIPADTLASLTSPSGQLSRELAAVANRPITLAIDPMILASIRILGNSAPVDAVDWLDRLTQATNESFPLSYADSDIALQAQAGAPTLLAPISFEQDIDPSLFTTPPATEGEPVVPLVPPGSGESTPPSPSPTPTPTSGPVVPPTTAELLDFNYTTTDVGWPSAGVVSSADLAVFAASGLGSTILSGANVDNPDSSVVPNSALELDHTVGLTTDDALQNSLRAAAGASSLDAWRGAMAEASALLAVVAAEQPNATRILLTTFDRASTASQPFLAQTLDALEATPWQKPGTLQAARSATPTADVTFASQSEPDARVDTSTHLLTRETELTAFSTALAAPLEVTGTARLEVLSLLSVAWESQSAAWHTAADASLATSLEVLNSVVVTTKGPINVVGSKVDIPVTLTNALDQAVTVRIDVVPSNGRLIVGSDTVATIDANSARAVKVPVTAAVGNGEVTLRVSLFSPTGVPIGEPGMIAINVRADWESLGTAVFAVLVVLFFGFGVWRNIARRRKGRTTPPETDADTSAEEGERVDVDAGESVESAEPTESSSIPTTPEPPKAVTDSVDGARE